MNISNNISKINIDNKMNEILDIYKNNINNLNLNFLDKNIISKILIDCYGKKFFLYKLSRIFLENNYTIRISLFDKNIKKIVKKSIYMYNLDLNINEDNDDIIIYIPPITEEKKINIIKLLKKETELYKIMIRNVRKKFKNKIKLCNISKDEKNIFNKILQKLTDLYINKINILYLDKEKKIINN